MTAPNIETGIDASEEKIREVAELRVKDEIKRGVQMIQYQVITLMTTNGQAPFVTVFMYLDEVPEGQTRDDLALVTEEVLRQRMQGVKNEQGVYITPAFPKLIYVLGKIISTKIPSTGILKKYLHSVQLREWFRIIYLKRK